LESTKALTLEVPPRIKARTTKGEASKGRDAPRADTEEDLSINPFARRSKIPRDDPMEDKETNKKLPEDLV
jgi:hypothetical protein